MQTLQLGVRRLPATDLLAEDVNLVLVFELERRNRSVGVDTVAVDEETQLLLVATFFLRIGFENLA